MLHAFAHRQNRRVAGDHVIIHDDPAFHRQSGRLGQCGCRTDADRHHDDVSSQFATIFQADGGDAVILAHDLRGVAAGHDRLAAPFQFSLQQEARRFIQLAFHQRGHQVDDRDVHAAQGQAVRRLKPQQTAADNHGAAALFRRRQHLVAQIAERDYARQVLPRDGDDERVRSRGQQQAVIRFYPARLCHHRPRVAVDADHRVARNQRDPVVGIPVIAVDDDVLEGFLAREYRGKHDAVVVHPRFRAENRHIEAVAIAGEDFLYRAAAGHAVADHHQLLTDRRSLHRVAE